MKRLFGKNKKRKLKDSEIEEGSVDPDGETLDDIGGESLSKLVSKDLDFMKDCDPYQTLNEYSTTQHNSGQSVEHSDTGAVPFLSRATSSRISTQSITLNPTSPYRKSNVSIQSLAFRRQSSGRSTGGNNFAAIQNRALALHEENRELTYHKEHSDRRIQHLENQLAAAEDIKVKLAHKVQKSLSATDDLSKIIHNLYAENENLRFIANSGMDSEAMKQKDELLRKESIKNAKLERKIVDICQRLDKINRCDGKTLKRQSGLFRELKAIGERLSSGQEDIKVQIGIQNIQADKAFQQMQKLIEEICNLRNTSTMVRGENNGNIVDAESMNANLYSRCPDSVKELCVPLMKLIGTKWPTFAVALGVPPNIVGEMCNNVAKRLSFENMFLKIIATAAAYGELSVSMLLMACRKIGINPYRDSPISSIHEEVLRRKTDRLANGLHPASVLIKLRESMVVTASEIEYILGTESIDQQIQRLLDVLPFLGENGFNALLDALKETGDKYLAEELQYEETLLTQSVANDEETVGASMDVASPPLESTRSLSRHSQQRELYNRDMAAMIRSHADMKTQICEIHAHLIDLEKKSEHFV